MNKIIYTLLIMHVKRTLSHDLNKNSNWLMVELNMINNALEAYLNPHKTLQKWQTLSGRWL